MTAVRQCSVAIEPSESMIDYDDACRTCKRDVSQDRRAARSLTVVLSIVMSRCRQAAVRGADQLLQLTEMNKLLSWMSSMKSNRARCDASAQQDCPQKPLC